VALAWEENNDMTKALVLSGGGSVGAAWETGVAAGLIAGGVDLPSADLILGTSAGSSVGVQIAARHDLVAQVERYRAAAVRHAAGERTGVIDIAGGRMSDLFERGWAAGREDDAIRAEIAKVSLEAKTISEEEFLKTFRYLHGEPWPANFTCTCVDCVTTDFVPLSAYHEVELRLGVAGSIAIPGFFPPVTAGSMRLVDGGVLSPSHLDLAVGHDRILFINMSNVPARELAAVKENGATLHVVEPDEASREAMGTNLNQASFAFGAVERGLEQGTRAAGEIGDFWNVSA
jgi:NTE family protein